MESPAEQSCSSQSTTSSEPLNWAMAMEVDGLSKRKSVSFVDEKLILDALNSTNSTTNGNGNGGKSTGKHNNHHHHHHQNSNGRSNGHGHSKGGNNKSAAAAAAAATNGAKNNAVIVYYSDPQREINVDQLLTTTEPTKNGVNGSGGGQQTNGHHRSNQNNSRGQSNGNHHREHQHRDNHHRDQHRHQNRQNGSGGGDEDRRRSAVLSNGHTPSKMADNWRTKGLRMDQPQYQPVRERIGNGHHHHPGNGGHSNGHSACKANGRGQHQPKGGMPLLQSPGTTTTGNGKVSGTFSKQQQQQQHQHQQQQQSVPPPKPSSAPITIYYTTPECSTDVIEQNLKQLQLKQKAAEASSPVADSISENTTTTTEAGNGRSITLEKEGEEGKEAALRANGSTTADAFSTSSITSSATTSQVNVINDKVELSESKSESESSSPESDAKSTSDTTTTISSTAPIAAAMPITLTAGGDQYDVINGGVPIAPATLPTTGERHPIRCTLVSHPGHFYVKFVDEAGEALLSTMNEFYSLEEHLIELSVELLRPGQYFAACRKRPPTAEREWIRVQLQSVEGPDLINCLLIDEGCFGIFRCADLQPLYNQFRAVAKQAVRASLSGVIPKEIDWLPQQSLDFKKLISDRPLHSGAQVFDQAAFEEKGCLQLELYFAEKGGDIDDSLAGRSVAEVIVERDIASKK